MSDVYLEVLQNYLNGSEWRQSVEMFVSSNCKYFHNITDLDHQQYALWKTFQEIVETILEMALDSVGGNLATLERALDNVQNQPSRGPRDDLVKDVLERLLSFTEFETFAAMMKQACDNAIQQERNSGGGSTIHVDGLLRMGFRTHDIEAVLSTAPAGASLEDLVMALSAHVSTNTGGANISSASKYSNMHRNGAQDSQLLDAKYQYDVHDVQSPNGSPNRGNHAATAGNSTKEAHPLLKFTEEAAAEGEVIDINELNAKFVIAESILDSFDGGARAGFGQGDAALSLIRWAEDMKLLLHDIYMAHTEQIPCVAMCFNCPEGLIQWYKALEITRLEVNTASAAGNMLSDAELHRMAELDKIAAMGTADEQLLHSLITRHDEVCLEVDRLHRGCSLLVATERGVKRENLEQLYLYLKQQVANGVDLDMITDELHEHVYSLVSSSKGGDVINLLLDMHIYEDEQIMLKRRIQSIVGSPSKGEGGDGTIDGSGGVDVDGHRALDFGDAELQEVNGAAGIGGEGAPHCDQAASDSKHAVDGFSPFALNADGTKGSSGGIDSKDGTFSAMSAAQRMQHDSDSVMFAADSKADTVASSRGFTGDSSSSRNGVGPSQFASGSSGSDVYLAGLKDQHRTCIAQLKELLESEKARKLKALEDKLMRRRALQQQQRTQAKDSGDTDRLSADTLAAEQARAVQEVEAEIEEVQSKYEGMAESMVSGLKKRCLNELIIAKRNHENISPGKAGTAGRPGNPSHPVPLLSTDDLREAHQRAADDLKKRFERDQKALLDSLEHERSKQRERVLKQLAAKRKQAGGIDKHSGGKQEEERAALNKMNIEFDAMVANALSNAQEHALLALSAIHLTDANLAPAAVAHGSEDAYLDDDITHSGGSLQSGREWLQRVYEVKASYCSASADLIQRLRVNTVSAVTGGAGGNASSTDSGTESNVEAFTEVAGLMARVVTDAFDHHLSEEASAPQVGHSRTQSSRASAKFMKKPDDSARVKAGILEEFERTKRDMEESLAQAQSNSRHKLAGRRTSARNSTSSRFGNNEKVDVECTLGDDDADRAAVVEAERLQKSLKQQEHMLEVAVDAYLGGEPVPDIASAYATASEAAARQHTQQRRQSAELDESEYRTERSRIKSVHVEKEQSLLMDLQNNMLEKKRVLEERLRRRRKAAQGDIDGDGDGNGSGGEDEFSGNIAPEEAASAVRLLEQAFEKITVHLKGLSKDQLASVDIKSLVDVMDRSARGERVSFPAATSGGGLQTNATLARPVAVSGGAEEKWSENSDSHTFSPSILGSLPPLQSVAYGGGLRPGKSEDKDSMAGEVKRISLEYNEEKQKLDLMMKIQQARQRQSLQRKLFEKSQRKAQLNQGAQSYSPDEDTDDSAQDKDYNSIEIGANRGLSMLKLRQPSNLQPAFKGLPAEAYQGSIGAGGGAGYNNNKANQQSMAMRGMNLGPMMRK